MIPSGNGGRVINMGVFRNLSINKKLFSSFFIVILIMAVLSSTAVYYLFDLHLREELKVRGILVARNLAARSPTFILLNNRPGLQEHIEEEKELANDVAYVLVLDIEQKPIVHTFGRELPAGLIPFNILKAGRNYQIEPFYAVEGDHREYIYDVAVPIIVENKHLHLGVVRVGLRLAPTLAKIHEAVGSLILIALFSAAICLLISWLVSRRIAMRLAALTSTAEDFALGKLEAIPKLGKNLNCWEVMNCGKTDCPAYEKNQIPCWYRAGTLCQATLEGKYAQKIGDCRECKYFQKRSGDEIEHLGKAFMFMGASLDKHEKELKKFTEVLETRVEERTAELKAIYERLSYTEKLSALGKLTASIAHEFNNPLFGIKMVLEQIGDMPNMGGDERKMVGMAITESNRIAGLIQNLQDFYEPFTGRIVPLDVHQAIEQALEICGNELTLNGTKLVRDFAQDLPKIPAVADQIKQVFLNIITNAGEAMVPAGGLLTIQTRAAGNKVCIAFKDTGCGIARENLGKIFDPCFTTKKTVKGTGLGLSGSYGIVRKHCGDILVESVLNEGSTFTVELPIAAGGTFAVPACPYAETIKGDNC